MTEISLGYIPHDEIHMFLHPGPRDKEFVSWCRFFDNKGVEYEIGGGGDRWTIYKHVLHTNIDKREITRCCPTEEDL